MLAQAVVSMCYWPDAFMTALTLIKALPTTALQGKIPYSFLFKRNPDYKNIKVFGCACFPYLRLYNKHKQSYRSEKCVFLGPSESHKGFKCLSSSGRLYVSRHVNFNETEFPFKKGFLKEDIEDSSTLQDVISAPLFHEIITDSNEFSNDIQRSEDDPTLMPLLILQKKLSPAEGSQ